MLRSPRQNAHGYHWTSIIRRERRIRLRTRELYRSQSRHPLPIQLGGGRQYRTRAWRAGTKVLRQRLQGPFKMRHKAAGFGMQQGRRVCLSVPNASKNSRIQTCDRTTRGIFSRPAEADHSSPLVRRIARRSCSCNFRQASHQMPFSVLAPRRLRSTIRAPASVKES